MKNTIRSIFSASIALAVAVFPLFAVAQDAGGIVREVSVRHLDDLPADPDYVLALTSVREGAALSQPALSRDVRSLLDSRRFSYAGVEVEQLGGDDVRVTYVVRRRLRFSGTVEVTGNTFEKSKNIKKWMELRNGDFLDDAVLATHTAKVRAKYRKYHFPDVRVDGRVLPEPDHPGYCIVSVSIDEGQRNKVLDVEFEGNSAIKASELRSALGVPSYWNPLRIFRKKDFSASEREEARAAVRDHYMNAGYLDARVSSPRLDADGDGRLTMVFVIDEGPLYHVASIDIAGVTLFDKADVLAMVDPLAVGSIASRSEIQAAARRVREYFTSRGYADTTVRTVTNPVAGRDAALDIRLEVHESALARIRNIFIRGNTASKDKVIRREISINPGEVFDTVAAERSKRRLENLGYFETVRFFDTPIPSEPGTRDLVYEVTEKSTGQFMVGVGFSSVDNLIGFAEISQGNFDILNWPTFRGGGQKARASVEVASKRTSVEVSVSEPWFLDRRLNLTVDAYRREREYDEYDECRIGAGVSLAFPARIIPGRFSIRYGIESAEFDDIAKGPFVLADDPSTPFDFHGFDDSQFNASLRFGWSFDTRDKPFVPTRGMQTTIGFETRNSWTGSDNEIYKADFTFRHWFPLWFGHVFSVKLRANVVDTWDPDEELHYADRLYLGGGHSLRGFDFRSVGPKALYSAPEYKDSGMYRSVGGQTLAMASAEYSIPLGKLFRLAAFYDIGNVWADPFDADFGEYAASYGGGIRIDIPGFPIRFDYAIPVEKDDDYTDTRHWVIWIGFD